MKLTQTLFMQIRIICFLVSVALAGCASTGRIERHGSSYDKGVDAFEDKDYPEARRQWSSSVNEGEVLALNGLGYLLYYGLGGNADPDKAVVLLKRGAEAGHSEAQWHLGKAFEDGKGTARDYIQAYAWYRCALAAAESTTDQVRHFQIDIAEGVRKSIVVLVDKMSPEQFAEGSRLAKEYVVRYSKLRSSKPWL